MNRKEMKNKKGMTLIELLVAVGIMSIVTTGLAVFFSYVWRSRVDEINRGQSLVTASSSVSKMSENIRKASQADSGSYALGSADDFNFIFYSDVDSDGNRERVRYYLDGTSIMAGTAEPILGDSPTYPPIEEDVIKTVASNVTNEETEPIFVYYNASGSVLETPASPATIRRIGLNVSVNTNPGRISDTLIQTFVSPRNLNK